MADIVGLRPLVSFVEIVSEPNQFDGKEIDIIGYYQIDDDKGIGHLCFNIETCFIAGKEKVIVTVDNSSEHSKRIKEMLVRGNNCHMKLSGKFTAVDNKNFAFKGYIDIKSYPSFLNIKSYTLINQQCDVYNKIISPHE